MNHKSRDYKTDYDYIKSLTYVDFDGYRFVDYLGLSFNDFDGFSGFCDMLDAHRTVVSREAKLVKEFLVLAGSSTGKKVMI